MSNFNLTYVAAFLENLPAATEKWVAVGLSTCDAVDILMVMSEAEKRAHTLAFLDKIKNIAVVDDTGRPTVRGTSMNTSARDKTINLCII